MKKKHLLIIFVAFVSISLSAQIPTDNLVGYWPFNGNANDESGYGNDGTVYGATITTDRFGLANKAYYFDGLNDYIHIPFNNNLTNVSVSFWYNASSATSTWPTFFWFGQNANINNIVLYCQLTYYAGANGNLFSRIVTTSTNYYDIQTANVPTLNAWHHVCVIFDKTGNLFKLYLDDILAGQITTVGDLLTSDFINIGTHDPAFNDEWVKGSLDDYRIYNRALTNSEIDALYHEGGWDSGLVGYWL